MKQKPQDKLKKNSRKGLQQFEMSISPSIIAHADWIVLCVIVTVGNSHRNLSHACTYQRRDGLDAPVAVDRSAPECAYTSSCISCREGRRGGASRGWWRCVPLMQCNSSTCDYIDPNSKCHSQAYVHSYLIQLQMFNKVTIANRLISLTILVHMLTLTKVRCFFVFFLVFLTGWWSNWQMLSH